MSKLVDTHAKVPSLGAKMGEGLVLGLFLVWVGKERKVMSATNGPSMLGTGV